MRRRIKRLLDNIFRSVPSTPPPDIEQYTPTNDERIWAKRESEARVRRLRELGVYVDLRRVEHGH
jgi:hypothetical protein